MEERVRRGSLRSKGSTAQEDFHRESQYSTDTAREAFYSEPSARPTSTWRSPSSRHTRTARGCSTLHSPARNCLAPPARRRSPRLRRSRAREKGVFHGRRLRARARSGSSRLSHRARTRTARGRGDSLFERARSPDPPSSSASIVQHLLLGDLGFVEIRTSAIAAFWASVNGCDSMPASASFLRSRSMASS